MRRRRPTPVRASERGRFGRWYYCFCSSCTYGRFDSFIQLGFDRVVEADDLLGQPPLPIENGGLRNSGFRTENVSRKTVFRDRKGIRYLQSVDKFRDLGAIFLAADMQADNKQF